MQSINYSSLLPPERRAAQFRKSPWPPFLMAFAAIVAATAAHAQSPSLGTKIAEYVQTPAEVQVEYYDATCHLTDFCTNFPPNPAHIPWTYTLTPEELAQVKRVKGATLVLTAVQTSYYIDSVTLDQLQWTVNGEQVPATTTNAFYESPQFGFGFGGGYFDLSFVEDPTTGTYPVFTQCNYCWTGEVMTLQVPKDATSVTVSGCFSCNGNTESGAQLYLNILPPGIIAGLIGGKDQKTVISNSLTATFPLGGDFTIALLDGANNPVPATYDFSSPTNSGNVGPNALFPNSIAFQYSQPVAGRGAFHAAHLGNVTLTITPKDSQSSVSPQTLTLNVVNPASLGSSHPELDQWIYAVADLTGIPPNFIKAQVAQESPKLDPMTYRYEPLTIDEVSISRGDDLRANQFSDFRFATIKDAEDSALAQGTSTDSDDLATLNHFSKAGATPTALEIVDQYNDHQHWYVAKSGNPHYKALKASDFTAQTSLSSSYGYMQMTYKTAIQNLMWPGINGVKNPSFLFDTNVGLNSGESSLTVGNQFMLKLYNKHNAGISKSPSLSIADTQALIDSFRTAWLGYNGGSPYPDEVIARIPSYQVVAAGSIF